MPRSNTKALTPAVVKLCRGFVLEAAAAYNVPPAYIVAHIAQPQAHRARVEVWNRMLNEVGLRRHQVAKMFGRDLRRVRASALEGRTIRHRKIRTAASTLDGEQAVWRAIDRAKSPRKGKATGKGAVSPPPVPEQPQLQLFTFD